MAEIVTEFTIEEELLFARRLEEGYDLFDPRYAAWLKSKDLGGKQCTQQPVVSPSSKSQLPTIQPPPTVSPVICSQGYVSPTTSLANYAQGQESVVSTSPVSSMQGQQSIVSPIISPAVSSQGKKSTSPVISFTLSTATPQRPPVHGQRSPLSDLLNLPVVNNISKPKTGSARVLTSDECWSKLREKEEKKKQEAEEKAKRKQEREQKKKEKEEEKKRKAEERVRKTEEREKKRKELEELKAQRAAQREALKIQKLKKRPPSKCTAGSAAATGSSAAIVEETSTESADSGSPTATDDGTPQEDARPVRKKSRLTVDSNIYSDLCCVCFGSYGEDEGTGREWLQCPCKRWIHRDCILPSISNDNKLCPIC